MKTAVQFHPYEHEKDYARVDEFLIRNHQTGNLDGNWVEPAWEYMHFHPLLNASAMSRIGVWEQAGEIAAVVHYEWRLGEAFFQFHPNFRYLRAEMLDYAEGNLTGISRKDGRKYLCAYVNDNDEEFLALVQTRGYVLDPEGARPMYRFDIPDPFPAITLPDGFCLTSLAEDCDWARVHRVLHRGFNNPGEPVMSEAEFAERKTMFDTPSARRDLKIAVKAPNGEFASFCGMFYEPRNHFAYVEPVATEPTYRRLGLGKAAVLEGIHRCAALGAAVAYVGSDQQFYQGIGFKKVYTSQCWVKYWVD